MPTAGLQDRAGRIRVATAALAAAVALAVGRGVLSPDGQPFTPGICSGVVVVLPARAESTFVAHGDTLSFADALVPADVARQPTPPALFHPAIAIAAGDTVQLATFCVTSRVAWIVHRPAP